MAKNASARMALSLAAALAPALAAALALSPAACTEGDSDGHEVTPASVFAAGHDEWGRAMVWKDGAEFGWAPGAGGDFYSVCVSRGTVHAVGQAPDGRPFHWRSDSGECAYLGSGQGRATSVRVSGGRIYVAGWDAAGGAVWRDGAELHGLGAGSRPCAIAIHGTDVYAAGRDGAGGRVWLNGDPMGGIGGMGGEGAELRSMDVSRGAAYAAGECDGRPAWTRAGDGGVHFLGSGGGTAGSLQISGDLVYVAGRDGGGGMVWMGRLGDPDMSGRIALGGGAEPESVFAFGANVYSGGWMGGGRVWIDGDLLHDFGAGSGVHSVFVVTPQ